MSDTRLRPRSITEIIDAAFSLYRRDAMDYIVVGAFAFTPSLLFQLFQVTNPSPGIGNSLLMLAGALVSLVTFSLMNAVLARIGSTAYLGGTPDVAETVREVLPRLGTLVAAGLMKGIMIMLGALAMLVGSFYFAARYFAVEQVVILEGSGSSAAFERSTALSDGRKWHILGTLLLAYLLYFMLSVGVVAIAGVASILGSPMILLVVSTLTTIVLFPMIGLTQMVLYYDARIRSEGFDLDQMAGSLDAAAAGGAG